MVIIQNITVNGDTVSWDERLKNKCNRLHM